MMLLAAKHVVLNVVQVKETATRMLTNFSVQAGTNDFYTAQRLFKDAGAKALPQVRTVGKCGPIGALGTVGGAVVASHLHGHPALRASHPTLCCWCHEATAWAALFMMSDHFC